MIKYLILAFESKGILFTRGFHKHTKLAIIALMSILFSHIFPFSSLFVPFNFCKHEIKHQWIQGHCISMNEIA